MEFNQLARTHNNLKHLGLVLVQIDGKEIGKLNVQELQHHTDDRGWLVEFVKSSSVGTVAQVEVISFKEPHIKRGGHYHKLKKEWVVCVFGKCEVKLADIKSRDQETYFLTKPYERLCIDPFVYHIFESKGESPCIVVVATNRVFEKEKPDTYHDINKLNIRIRNKCAV